MCRLRWLYSTCAKPVQEALDGVCAEQEKVLGRLGRAGVQVDLGPKMNEEMGASHGLEQEGSPVAKLDNEDPGPETISYEELIKSWQ